MKHLVWIFGAGLVVTGLFVAQRESSGSNVACGQASRTFVDKLECGRIALEITKVCATTTINGQKTEMPAVEVTSKHPGVSGTEVTIYEIGGLSTSMPRLIKENSKKAGEPFVIYEQSYNKEGAGGFKKAWAVTDAAGKAIEKLLLKIQLKDGGEVCKKEVPIQSIWGTKWWSSGNAERDKF